MWKKTCVVLFISGLGIFGIAHGQYVSIPRTINTPYGTGQVPQYIYMPSYYGGANAERKFKFVAQLQNDSLITLKSVVGSKDKKMFVKVKLNGKKIELYPAETKRLTWVDGKGDERIGIPADSCWLFLVKRGMINGYSSIPSNDLGSAIAIQKNGEQTIIPLNKENLTMMTSDVKDENITKWIEKSSFEKAIKRYNCLKLGTCD